MEMIQLLDAEEAGRRPRRPTRSSSPTTATAIFDDGFSWVGGNPRRHVTVVEFLDYQCGFCRKAQPDVGRARSQSDGDIRLIVKEMPILGPGSELAARAAVATLIAKGPEAYAALHDRLMALEGPDHDASLDQALAESGLDPAAIRVAMHDPEVDRRLAATRALAEKLAISGTPTFVFDNRMVRGYVPLDTMQRPRRRGARRRLTRAAARARAPIPPFPPAGAPPHIQSRHPNEGGRAEPAR